MLLNYAPPTTPYLTLVYQDDDLLVLNKPSGLLSVPGKDPSHHDCLLSRVVTVYPDAKLVHRLDMATSGIMCFAMHRGAQRELSRQFQERTTQKTYIAKISGRLNLAKGEVNEPLICDWPNRPKQKVCYETGKPALTHFEVLKYGDDATWVSLKPVTGRSHQLRVHMQHLGHPILGDRLYASDADINRAERLLLHAQSLTLAHPRSKKTMTFQALSPF